jgi:hypothetical protein
VQLIGRFVQKPTSVNVVYLSKIVKPWDISEFSSETVFEIVQYA